jgi:hypothetical protein
MVPETSIFQCEECGEPACMNSSVFTSGEGAKLHQIAKTVGKNLCTTCSILAMLHHEGNRILPTSLRLPIATDLSPEEYFNALRYIWSKSKRD